MLVQEVEAIPVWVEATKEQKSEGVLGSLGHSICTLDTHSWSLYTNRILPFANLNSYNFRSSSFSTQLRLNPAKFARLLPLFGLGESSQMRTFCHQALSNFRESETMKGMVMYQPQLTALDLFLSGWRPDLCNLRKLEISGSRTPIGTRSEDVHFKFRRNHILFLIPSAPSHYAFV
jgi:hypothetical protein